MIELEGGKGNRRRELEGVGVGLALQNVGQKSGGRTQKNMEVETAWTTGIFDGKVNGTGIGLVRTVEEDRWSNEAGRKMTCD
jgi:hypothetical protein